MKKQEFPQEVEGNPFSTVGLFIALSPRMFPQVSQAFPISLKMLGNQDKTPALWVPEKNHIF